MQNKRFYVYIYLDPRKKGHYCYKNISFLYEPIYVGKGTGTRKISHLKCINKHGNPYFGNKLHKIASEFSKQEMQKYILIFGSLLEEQEAFDLETDLIEEIGRHDLKLGSLTNLTDGGDGASGVVVSEETKQKLSEVNKGENNPNFGKPRDEETRTKISDTLIATHPHYSSENNPNFQGQKRSEETRRRISESKKGENHPNFGKHLSKGTRTKISEANKSRVSFSGENHPLYGKPRDEETRKKISEALSGRTTKPHSAETRQKIKESWTCRKQKALENGTPLVSEETKKKISENQNRSEETRKKMSESHIGKKLSEETRQKMSIAQSKREVGLKRSEETKRKISLSKSGANHPNYGKQHSVETRAKLKEAWILRKQRALENSEPLISEETRQRISNTQKGRKISETELQKRIGRKTSEDTKIKISKVLKEKYADGNHFNLGRQLSEDTKKKISKSLSGKQCTEETKQKISEAKKGKAPFKGENHPNYGKHRSEETRQKISESLKKKQISIKAMSST